MKHTRASSARLRAVARAIGFACSLITSTAYASSYEPSGIDLGGTTFNDGFGALDPGWITIQLIQYEDNGKFYSNTGSQNPVLKNPDVKSLLWLPQIIYTSPIRIFGGALGFTALLPVVALSAHSDPVNPFIPTLNSKSGVGDINFGTFLQMAPIVENGRPVFSQRFEFDVTAPTGVYDPHRSANPGSGFWSLIPYWSVTVLPTEKTEISMRLHYLYNFTNNNPGDNNPFGVREISNFQAGQAVWANFAASYKVSRNIDVGINGFWFRQITDDKVNGQAQLGGRTENISLGPGAQWTVDRHNFVYANLYFPVFERNTSSGLHANLRWIHVF